MNELDKKHAETKRINGLLKKLQSTPCQWCQKTSEQIDSLEFELEELKNYQLHAQDDLTAKDKELEAKGKKIETYRRLATEQYDITKELEEQLEAKVIAELRGGLKLAIYGLDEHWSEINHEKVKELNALLTKGE